MTLVSDRDRWGRQWSSLDSMAVSLKFSHPWLFHWKTTILRCLAVINVPSDQWFLCLTQIAEDGRGAIINQWLLYEIPGKFWDRETCEPIWMGKIMERSSSNMKSRRSENNTQFKNSCRAIGHPIFRQKSWHLNVHRKLISPSMTLPRIAPRWRMSSRAFSCFSGHKSDSKSVGKV